MRAGALLALLLCAQAVSAEEVVTPHVTLDLISDVAQVPAGGAFRAAVRLRMDPGWHVYWQHPGQAGLPTVVEWEGVDVTLRPLPMPAPHVFREGENALTTYGYADEVFLIVDAAVAPTARGSVEVAAGVEFLVCKEECIPGEAVVQRSVAVGAERQPSEHAERFAFFLERIPEVGGLALQVTRSGAGRQFSVEMLVKPCAQAGAACALVQSSAALDDVFIPDRMSWSEFMKPVAVEKVEEGLRIRLEGKAPRQRSAAEPRMLGLLQLTGDDGKPWWSQVNVPVIKAATPVSPAAEVPELSLLHVLLMALLGGMILNLMPCVFPVLALKVYAFASLVQQDRRHVMMHAAAYTGGIVGSMVVLALVVMGLKAAGHGVGWGFQFQEPLFIALVAALLVAFALNLFGAFEITPDASGVAKAVEERNGLMRSAGEGVLAVVLATPCSAPFLGTAVGFALARPADVILAVFVALGLGLALPFVALVAVPGWARLLPRPGPWMHHARQMLGFALLGTVVWLVWILGSLTGVDGMAQGLGFLCSVGFAAWVWGRVQMMGGRTRTIAALLLLGGLGVVGARVLPRQAAAPELHASDDGWEVYSEDAVAGAVADGQPVFVDFTAEWCLTCKANERMVIAHPDVQDAFKEHGVRLFKADWTRRDETIRKVLERHGKAGVPMYLLYSPSSSRGPRVLPEVLTVKRLVADIEQAAR